jgi:hypothetical protein
VQYDADQQDKIEKFLDMVKPFRRDATSKVHRVTEYLDSMKQVNKQGLRDGAVTVGSD